MNKRLFVTIFLFFSVLYELCDFYPQTLSKH